MMASYYDIHDEPRENLLVRSRRDFGAAEPELQFIDTSHPEGDEPGELRFGLSVDQARELVADLSAWLARYEGRKAA